MDLSPLWITLKVSLAATVFVFITGIAAAWGVNNLKRGKAVIDAVFSLPLVLPPTVVGFILLIALGSNSPIGKLCETFGTRLVFTWQGAAIASAFVSFPVMYRGIRGALEQVDINMIQAGRTLGMKEFTILRKVMLPVAAPGIIASVVLSFARCLGEFGATLMVAGNLPGKTQTMSIAVYTAMQSSNRELAFKWVLIIVFYSLFILVVMNSLASIKGGRTR